ncbi:MAG: hypothetical protein IKS49_04605 [Actinomycetaceae bacterium]|nr:hypothetical protein [Actinomycetaceae bacterium]
MSDMYRVGRGIVAGGLEVWGTLALPNDWISLPTGVKSKERFYQSFYFPWKSLEFIVVKLDAVVLSLMVERAT